MQGLLNLVVFEPTRMVYVLTPKCGSSSVVAAFATMSGLEGREMGRSFAWKANADGRLTKLGLIMRQMKPGEVRGLRDRYPDYRFLGNIRAPYARAVSNYFSKINRYSKHFDRTTYVLGKLGHLFQGPGTWSDGRVANGFMQRRIGFEDMLAGLTRHGINFDSHFAQQSDLLQLNHMRYDRLLRLETLDEVFPEAMAEFGLPAGMLARLGAVPHGNSSRYRGNEAALLTDATRAKIRSLYPDDFAKLGYPA